MKRIPISLKVDETEEFYSEFIERKKEDKELTTFILDILKAYYHDEKIKALVDNYIIEQNPFISIYEQLQKIKMQHKRHANAVSMLGDYTEKALDIAKEEEKGKPEEASKDEKAELIRLLGKYNLEAKSKETEDLQTPPKEEKREEKKKEIVKEPPNINIAPKVENVKIVEDEEDKTVPPSFLKTLGSM